MKNRINNHGSASEQKLKAYADRLAVLETVAQEYNLLLNHLVKRNNGTYIILKSDLTEDGPPQIVRSVIASNGSKITFTLCTPTV